MISQTEKEYKAVITLCKGIFEKKTSDYGTAWRIMRLPSITDQIYIKAKRIRSIQEKGTQKINEDLAGEFIAIVNYCVMALIQIELQNSTEIELPADEATAAYNKEIKTTIDLLLDKNHDYGEAWRDMRISSIVDIILMKIFRTKQIENNHGKTLISEGVDANYRDMINYAVFCLIKINAGENALL